MFPFAGTIIWWRSEPKIRDAFAYPRTRPCQKYRGSPNSGRRPIRICRRSATASCCNLPRDKTQRRSVAKGRKSGILGRAAQKCVVCRRSRNRLTAQTRHRFRAKIEHRRCCRISPGQFNEVPLSRRRDDSSKAGQGLFFVSVVEFPSCYVFPRSVRSSQLTG